LKELFDKCKYKKIDIVLSGGEPSLYELHEIIDILSVGDYMLRIDINTNFSLHDVFWWSTLKKYKNVKLSITASCHLEQIEDLDGWLDKASQISNVDKFKVKFVITNDNFEETKSVIEKCIEKNIKYCLEGARAKDQSPLFNDEIKDFISCSNFENELSSNTIYKYDGDQCTHTEFLINVHENIKNAKCKKRVSIRGNMIESGCPHKMDKMSIYDLDDLDWTIIENCDCVNICNLCQVGELESL
jgi:organic radical activating enzyme